MSLTKQDAIQYMVKGYRVTHRFFSEKEWMEMENGKIFFEDGVKLSVSDFFKERNNEGWENGYSIISNKLKST